MLLRRGLALALPAVLLLSALPSTSQSLPESLLEQDGAGDVATIAPDGSNLGAAPGHEIIDIVRVAIEKGTSGMRFGIEVVDMEALMQARSPIDGSRSQLGPYFDFRGTHFQVDFLEPSPGSVCVRQYVPALDEFDGIGCLDAELEDGLLVVEFPSAWILDANGIPLRHPAELTNVFAIGERSVLILGSAIGQITYRDRAPDTGTWNGLLTPPDADQGDVILTPRVAVRASNGGPDVLVFEVQAENVAQEPTTAFLTASDVPSGWSVRTPARVQLAGTGTATFPVFVTIPGAHAHGSLETFQIDARDTAGTIMETLELGVKFLDVPQPAGHHDRLYLHQSYQENLPIGSFRLAFMTTLPDNEYATGEPQPPIQSSRQGTARTLAWNYELNPELSIGLDFETNKPVTGTLPMMASLAGSGTLTTSMRHCNPNDTTGADPGQFRCTTGSWFDLATQTQDVVLGQGQQDINIEAPVTAYADLVPYEPGALMAFHAVLETDDSPLTDFHVAAGGAFRLPLLEYRDPVDETHASLNALTIRPLGDVERLVPPGGTVWLGLQVTNAATSSKTFAFSVAGHRAAWAQVHPAEAAIAAGASKTIHVGITAPDDAYDGDYADIFVVAEDTADPATVTFQRFRATVDEDAKGDSLPAALHAGKDTPVGLPLLAVLAALAWARRRD